MGTQFGAWSRTHSAHKLEIQKKGKGEGEGRGRAPGAAGPDFLCLPPLSVTAVPRHGERAPSEFVFECMAAGHALPPPQQLSSPPSVSSPALPPPTTAASPRGSDIAVLERWGQRAVGPGRRGGRVQWAVYLVMLEGEGVSSLVMGGSSLVILEGEGVS